ncbi:MAG: tRNA lysidine(34) synthetase TilS, partial [Bacteroidota bacterium]
MQIEFSKLMRPFSSDRFLLAHSGGPDSVALFALFLHLRQHFAVHFEVMHIHHGPSEKYLAARNHAQGFVEEQCQSHQVPFHTNVPATAGELISEKALRDFRYNLLAATRIQMQGDWVVLAHHKKDQLETRLIRLIRGVGGQGIDAMQLTQKFYLRPLLDFMPADLQNYNRHKGFHWVTDPSNSDSSYLRNWLRNEWLQNLENYRPGAVASLSRSLEILAEHSQGQEFACIVDGVIK